MVRFLLKTIDLTIGEYILLCTVLYSIVNSRLYQQMADRAKSKLHVYVEVLKIPNKMNLIPQSLQVAKRNDLLPGYASLIGMSVQDLGYAFARTRTQQNNRWVSLLC